MQPRAACGVCKMRARRSRVPAPPVLTQTIGNACGTIGLLHSLANNRDALSIGGCAGGAPQLAACFSSCHQLFPHGLG